MLDRLAILIDGGDDFVQDQESAGRQRFFSLYNEATHLIAHLYHNITDFTLDLNDPIETRVLHLGELPISQAGLASLSTNGADAAARAAPRASRSMIRRVSVDSSHAWMASKSCDASSRPLSPPLVSWHRCKYRQETIQDSSPAISECHFRIPWVPCPAWFVDRLTLIKHSSLSV